MKLMGSSEMWNQRLRKERWRGKEESLPSQHIEGLGDGLKEGIFLVPGNSPKEPSKLKLVGFPLSRLQDLIQ